MTKPQKPSVTVQVDGRYISLEDFAGATKQPSPCRRTFGCIVGISVLSIITGGLALSVLAFFIPQFDLAAFLQGDMSFGLGPQQQSLENPTAFDPIAMLPQAQAMAGENAQLLEIEMRFARADGTMDLTATYQPAPTTTYTFMIEVPPPPDAPPVGVGGYTGGNFYQQIEVIAERPGQRRHVTITTNNSRTQYTYVTQGLRREPSTPRGSAPGTPIAAPTCALSTLWEQAIRRDAPRDAVATITYDQNGYYFSVQGVIRLRFNVNCELVN